VNPKSALSSLQNFNSLLAILWAEFKCGTLDISAAFIVNRYSGCLPMRLLKGSAAGSEVGDGLMGLWSDGRPTESYPETGSRELAGLVTTSRHGIMDHGLMKSPVPGRCDRSLHCENVVCIPGNARWFAPKSGQARIGSAPVRLLLRGTVSRRFYEDHEVLLDRDRCLTPPV
jgi:hypothetical protein